jgi:hypothetical protein
MPAGTFPPAWFSDGTLDQLRFPPPFSPSAMSLQPRPFSADFQLPLGHFTRPPPSLAQARLARNSPANANVLALLSAIAPPGPTAFASASATAWAAAATMTAPAIAAEWRGERVGLPETARFL